jgi:hypothetical protein
MTVLRPLCLPPLNECHRPSLEFSDVVHFLPYRQATDQVKLKLFWKLQKKLIGDRHSDLCEVRVLHNGTFLKLDKRVKN